MNLPCGFNFWNWTFYISIMTRSSSEMTDLCLVMYAELLQSFSPLQLGPILLTARSCSDLPPPNQTTTGLNKIKVQSKWLKISRCYTNKRPTGILTDIDFYLRTHQWLRIWSKALRVGHAKPLETSFWFKTTISTNYRNYKIEPPKLNM